MKVLKNKPLPDVIIYAFYRLNNRILLITSTAFFYVKCFLLRVPAGSGIKVWGKVYIYRHSGSEISIGKNVSIVSSPRRYAFNIFPQSKLRTGYTGAKIIIGSNVGFNSISIFSRSKQVKIGNNTIIGGNCQIADTDGHPVWPPEARHHYPGNEHDAPVDIGKNVYIGLNVIVLKGVTIGDNSVIAAGSVVNHSIPENCLAAGVPAKVVKYFTVNK